MANDADSLKDSANGTDQADRYRAAVTYVELDRAHRKRSRWSRIVAVSVIILVISLGMLAAILVSYLQGQVKNGEIAENTDLTAIEETFDEQGFTVDWDALRAINPDVVGWLYIPGTNVNYPVVHGKDNDYYLSHDFTGEQGWLAQFGSIFLDWRNNPNWSDEAYFIYGHHMNDGSMFASIAGMADQARFDASRTVYLLSPTKSFKLRSFSLIHCNADDPIVQISFASKENMAHYVQDKIDRSVVSVGDIPQAADIEKSFAFATCDNYSAGRFVLYAYIEDEAVAQGSEAEKAAIDAGASARSIDDTPASTDSDDKKRRR